MVGLYLWTSGKQQLQIPLTLMAFRRKPSFSYSALMLAC